MIIVLLLMSSLSFANCFELESTDSFSNKASLTKLIDLEVKAAKIPGLSVVIGNSKSVVYKQHFGDAKVDSIFDLASLTKVFTATGFLKELEKTDIAVSTNYKGLINYSDLLRHESGYKAGLASGDYRSTPHETFENISTLLPTRRRGKFHYSDINYLILALELERLSRSSLNTYLEQQIFNELNMDSTSFNPANCKKCLESVKGHKGVVHDPTSRFLGGVSGHAGLFSSIDDLSKFFSIFLNNGMFCNKEIISSDQLNAMTAKTKSMRGLGFDITSPYSRLPRGDHFKKNVSFGHTGFTGTSVWIDPSIDIFVIVLSNSVLNIPSKKRFLKLNQKISNLVGGNFLQ
jgi:CubicO group peptidase (beta-lactamase class C family)